MILKIRHAGSWWLYDGLSRIHYGSGSVGIHHIDVDRVIRLCNQRYVRLRWGETLDKRTLKDEKAGFLPSVQLLSPLNENTTEPICVSWVCSRDTENNENFFVFDEGYILNDEGKTIEIIR